MCAVPCHYIFTVARRLFAAHQTPSQHNYPSHPSPPKHQPLSNKPSLRRSRDRILAKWHEGERDLGLLLSQRCHNTPSHPFLIHPHTHTLNFLPWYARFDKLRTEGKIIFWKFSDFWSSMIFRLMSDVIRFESRLVFWVSYPRNQHHLGCRIM